MIDDKEQYFNYFNKNNNCNFAQTQSSSPQQMSRPKSSQYSLTKTQQLLPHITQQYQYRITNELLSYKIDHPRRDKLIIESRSPSKSIKSSLIRQIRKIKVKREALQPYDEPVKNAMSEDHCLIQENDQKGSIKRIYKTFKSINSSCNTLKNDYLISLQNNRMGKRLLNTKSQVQDSLVRTYYTYNLKNDKMICRGRLLKENSNAIRFRSLHKHFGRSNNNSKNLLNQKSNQQMIHHDDFAERRQERSLRKHCTFPQSPSFITNQNQPSLKENTLNHYNLQSSNVIALSVVGQGELTFTINNLIITTNPPLKPETSLLIQLIENQQQLQNILNQYYSEKNNYPQSRYSTQQNIQNSESCMSSAFSYKHLSEHHEQQFCLKFRIRYNNHIFLRFIINQGINQREMGVVRIDLQSFRTRRAGQFPFRVIKQLREINKIQHERDIFFSQFSGNLLRLKKGETSTTVKMEYQLSYRRFWPRESKFIGIDLQNSQ